MSIIILILALILLYLVKNHYEKFIVNPNVLTEDNQLLQKLLKFSKCSPTDVQCILAKQPVSLKPNEEIKTLSKKVNYKNSHRVSDLFPTSFRSF